MPVNRAHAFAAAVTGRVGPSGQPPNLMDRLMERLTALVDRGRVRSAAVSFQRSALFGEDLRVGPNAWCHSYGRSEKIRFGGQVICRGVIRLERWGQGEIVIGDRVYIGDDTLISCGERVVIGDDVLIAHGVQIFDSNSHPTDPELRALDFAAISGGSGEQLGGWPTAAIQIEPQAWIGFNSIILKGVHIGRGAIIAAGSVVTDDIPPLSVAAGNPARVIKALDPRTE
jgi:acetyltransferase-like isoleucine patch superfamily enzyme